MDSLPAKYYVDRQGRYLGAFGGIQHPDEVKVNEKGEEVSRKPGDIEYSAPDVQDAIEVPSPPHHGRDRWNGTGWDPYVPPEPDLDEELNQRDPVIRALVKLVPGGIDAVKAEMGKLAGR